MIGTHETAAAARAGSDGSGEAELVARSRAGDRAAFEEIVRRTARLVYARQYLETGDRHRAEDLAQETFFRAWRGIGQLGDAASLRPWLLTVARSVAADAFRRESRRKRGAGRLSSLEAAAGAADPAPNPEESAERNERRRRVTSALKSLPDEYSLPLTLRYVGGADYDTIGRQLGLSNGSLRGLLSRGMAKLREYLKD